MRMPTLLIFGAALSLAACNNPGNDSVRYGPQAIHPSPSLLAQRTSAGVAVQPDIAYAPATGPACADGSAAPCYIRSANDGSHPIID